jgi:2-polyprenyl-6-methoxyphenol hydroxylase-like FAD-dependent oxidoreductase
LTEELRRQTIGHHVREKRVNDPQVLVVGGGPVGLTLAIDLGKRGIRAMLVEQKDAPAFLPKMERCNARTMEIYRRLGIVDRIRAAGLGPDIPMDVFIALSMTEKPLVAHHYPSVNEARAEIKTINDGTQALEPYQLISQYTLEPLLKQVAEEIPNVSVRFGCELVEFSQDAQGVIATMRSKGKTETIRADYLVGCDGGASTVRKQLGIKLKGEANLLELRQALYRCDELYDRLPIGHGPGHGRHYHIADGHNSFLIMQDSTKHWTLHAVVQRDDDMKTLFEQIVGVPVKYEMLTCNPWRQNLLLAERFAEGRVFLAGDSVHLVIPTGGLGMNGGVGDAIDLSWKLAGTLQGWGGPDLLRSYEVERRQVGDRNVGASRHATLGRRRWRGLWRPYIRDNTAEGAALRAEMARVADAEQRKSNDMIGAELGYRYVDSPIIADIPGGPEHLFRTYEPTTWPGARLPHVWLNDGTGIQDHLPKDGYTLLRVGKSEADQSPLAKAIASYGAKVTSLDIRDEPARAIYGYDLLLLRPDLHVVWRGNTPPDNPQELAALATGH